MHLFLAIELPDTVKRQLYDQILSLQREYRQLNWVPQENYHITIHFFGEVENSKELIKKLEELLYDSSSFYLYAFGADLFIHDKIHLYINFNREKKLEEIADKVRYTFQEQDNMKYMPHLTIARYKVPSKQQYLLLKKKLHQLSIDLEIGVKKVVLFESISGRKNPIYKKIKEFKLT